MVDGQRRSKQRRLAGATGGRDQAALDRWGSRNRSSGRISCVYFKVIEAEPEAVFFLSRAVKQSDGEATTIRESACLCGELRKKQNTTCARASRQTTAKGS